MKPIDSLTSEQAAAIRGVFCDIDDTLTEGGKLQAEAFSALWRLSEAGLFVAPITGRPAGWCDHIVRAWPVDAVVGENGAFAMYLEQGRVREILHPNAAEDSQARLAKVQTDILAKVAGARVASDQAYRRYDLAIDFREEEPDLGLDAADQIAAIFKEHGAHAKISSIHVNGWFGDYDKLSMTQKLAQHRLGIALDGATDNFVFVGDSPNDEPMFRYFPLAVGVANVQDFAERIETMPSFVTRKRGGLGFAEFAETLLAKRA